MQNAKFADWDLSVDCIWRSTDIHITVTDVIYTLYDY